MGLVNAPIDTIQHVHVGAVVTKKQMWSRELQQFVPINLYRIVPVDNPWNHDLRAQKDKKFQEITAWLKDTYGRPEQQDGDRYWSESFGTICMSEKIYLFYLLKWPGRS